MQESEQTARLRTKVWRFFIPAVDVSCPECGKKEFKEISQVSEAIVGDRSFDVYVCVDGHQNYICTSYISLRRKIALALEYNKQRKHMFRNVKGKVSPWANKLSDYEQ